MSKYTPGPWTSEPKKAVEDDIDIWSQDWHIAIVMASAGKEVTEDESEANASLISAAPDLLEALKLAEWTTVEHGEQQHCCVCKRWKGYGHAEECAIGAAIRKAEGVDKP